MSNLIPPPLSSSPPPIVGPLDEEDDEFGDFRAAIGSYSCDDFLALASSQKSGKHEDTTLPNINLDVNSNNKSRVVDTLDATVCVSKMSDVYEDFEEQRIFDQFQSFESEDNVTNHLNECVDAKFVQVSTLDLEDEQTKTDNLDSISHNSNTNVSVGDVNEENEIDLGTSKCDGVSTEVLKKNDPLNEKNIENKTELVSPEVINISENLKRDCVNKTNLISEDHLESSPEGGISANLAELECSAADLKFTDFGNFANFDNTLTETDAVDDFDDFVNATQIAGTDDNDDDFGNFESSEYVDYSSKQCEAPFMEVNEKNAVEKSEVILKEIFPTITTSNQTDLVDEICSTFISDDLRDVTETNALIYQWSKSHSQKMLFKALNIDTRNILYGSAWQATRPTFATNFGFAALEPVKSEILTPTPVQRVSSPTTSSQKSNGDIPTAQFDWSHSGLINPLDYLEQLIASLDIPSTTNPHSNQSSSSSNEFLEEWDLWLQSTTTEMSNNVPENTSPTLMEPEFLPSSSKKLSFTPTVFDSDILDKEPENDFPPSSITSSFPNFKSKIIPFRETHISNDISEEPNWLQSTIVTPEVVRKEIIVPEDDTEFDDFQMISPNEYPKIEESSSLTPISDLTAFDFVKVPCLNGDEHILNPDQIKPSGINEDENDDFTEFHFSKPEPQLTLNSLQSVPLEPLKPTVQYSTSVTQINWPDPGVTEEDIKNIELTYSRKVDLNAVEGAEVKPEKKELNKNSSLDEDDWTDFVSVNPVKLPGPERTATPDLPLSVLNLGRVQAPKQPIPVITPSGLVQTKLSSNLTLQPKSVVQTSVQTSLLKPSTAQNQPSLISNQFALNLFATQSTSAKNQNDDDDWSDFVHSKPLPQESSWQKTSVQVKPSLMNGGSSNTNIIMNPGHFQNHSQPQRKCTNSHSAISSVSGIPELDFIAPKSRTNKK